MTVRIDPADLYNIGDTLITGTWINWIHNKAAPIAIAFEYYLEHLRVKHSPDSVSRLDCVFAFDNDEVSTGYAYANPTKKVYVLEVPDNVKISRHNYEIISHMSSLFANNYFGLILEEEELLISYWKGDDKTDYVTSLGKKLDYYDEILIHSGVRVIEIK